MKQSNSRMSIAGLLDASVAESAQKAAHAPVAFMTLPITTVAMWSLDALPAARCATAAAITEVTGWGPRAIRA